MRNKKLLIMLIVMMMSFCLMACGNKSSKQEDEANRINDGEYTVVNVKQNRDEDQDKEGTRNYHISITLLNEEGEQCHYEYLSSGEKDDKYRDLAKIRKNDVVSYENDEFTIVQKGSSNEFRERHPERFCEHCERYIGKERPNVCPHCNEELAPADQLIKELNQEGVSKTPNDPTKENPGKWPENHDGGDRPTLKTE